MFSSIGVVVCSDGGERASGPALATQSWYQRMIRIEGQEIVHHSLTWLVSLRPWKQGLVEIEMSQRTGVAGKANCDVVVGWNGQSIG